MCAVSSTGLMPGREQIIDLCPKAEQNLSLPVSLGPQIAVDVGCLALGPMKMLTFEMSSSFIVFYLSCLLMAVSFYILLLVLLCAKHHVFPTCSEITD